MRNKDVLGRGGYAARFVWSPDIFLGTFHWAQLSGLSVGIDHNYVILVDPAGLVIQILSLISLFDAHNWWGGVGGGGVGDYY